MLRYHRKGGESLFKEDAIIWSVKTQVNRLEEVMSQMEIDERLEEHSPYYLREIRQIERDLKKIRKMDPGS
jgi:hypothetical protein